MFSAAQLAVKPKGRFAGALDCYLKEKKMQPSEATLLLRFPSRAHSAPVKPIPRKKEGGN